MNAFAQERDAEKAARKLAGDRLAEEIASHAKTEKVILKEHKQHRQAERARIEICHALETKNAELQAALLNLQTTTDFLDVEALQEQEQELATAAHEAFDASDDGDGSSEPVSDKPPRALSRAPAPTQWFKNGSTRPKRSVPLPRIRLRHGTRGFYFLSAFFSSVDFFR